MPEDALKSRLGDLGDAAMKIYGPQKTVQVRVYPSSALGTWTTSSRLVQYFLPPNREVIWDRSGIAKQLSVAALGADIRLAYNSAVNNMYMTSRLQIGQTEVLNLANLNNGYSRCVRDASTPISKFYQNPRLSSDDSVAGVATGYAGSPSPSYQYPGGLNTMLAAAAFAAVTAANIIGENRYIPFYFTSATDYQGCKSQNTAAEIYVSDRVNATLSLQWYTDFSDYYGTVLATPYALPTGSGSVLEMTMDSVDKSFSAVTIANAGTYAQLVAAVAVTAAATMGNNVTISQDYLKLTLLANDAIENAEGMWHSENSGGREIYLPWIDQINQDAGTGTSFGNNVTLAVANRSVRAICAALVLPATNLRTTQCNGSDGSTSNLLTARAFINQTPDTNDVLNLSDTSLAQWNISNSLRGSMLGDAAAYMSHPVYVSNLSGIPLCELHKPENVLCEYGKRFDGPLVYQLSGTKDAVQQSVQYYVLSTRRCRVAGNEIMMLE